MDLFALEGQRAGVKIQRQEIKAEEEGEGNKGKGAGVFVTMGQRIASG